VVLALASVPIRLAAAACASPPAQVGLATITRKLPSALGRKETSTVRASTTRDVTSRPPAVIAASEPNVLPVPPVKLPVSTHVSASRAIAPLAPAAGLRPLWRSMRAVWVEFGSAPVTSTISSSLSARTYVVAVIPPPCWR
jgi:hypothetical protein